MNQKPYKILVVEDDKAIRTLIETALEEAQLASISAYNGASAVSQVRTQNPDVILLDLGLPDMDGIQVVDEIRRVTINPIITSAPEAMTRTRLRRWITARTIM